MTHWVIVVRI
jgi:hypothetical protein